MNTFTPTPLNVAYCNRFPRGENLTSEEHARVFYTVPCIPSTAECSAYGKDVHGLDLAPSLIRKAVLDKALVAYRVSKGYCFAPRDVDLWVESLRTA